MRTHVLPPVRMRGRMQANGGVVNCTSCWCSHTPAVISAPSRQPSKVRRHTNFESYSLHCWRSQSVKTPMYICTTSTSAYFLLLGVIAKYQRCNVPSSSQAPLPVVVAQLDDLCYLYLAFCFDHHISQSR